MFKKSILIIFLVFCVFYIHGEDSGELSISITPVGVIPLGENASSFTTGGGASLAMDFGLPSLPFLFIRTELDYEYMPIETKDALSVFSFSAGGGLQYLPFKKLTLSVFGTGGYYYGSITGDSSSSGGNIAFSGGVAAYYNISEAFSLGLSVDYTSKTALYDNLGLSIGTTIYPAV